MSTFEEYHIRISEVKDDSDKLFDKLIQNYEAEFSIITKKEPNEFGVFELDTRIDESVRAFIAKDQRGLPLGFSMIRVQKNNFEVCEFYIIPVFRKNKVGERFAHELFNMFLGNWEVKQIDGASKATSFWRAVINSYTSNNYKEDIYNDTYWGPVIRQRFNNAF